MDLIECYLSASRIAMQANCNNPSTWKGMYMFLKYLYNHLTCPVCHKLLDQPYNYKDGVPCLGCANSPITDVSVSVLECYTKMCVYIQNSPLYSVMCTRNEDRGIVELLTEVIGAYCPTNGLANGTINNEQQMEPVDNHDDVVDDVSNVTPSDVQLPVIEIKEDCANLQVFDIQSRKNRTTRYVNTKKKKNERRWGCRCGNATPTPGKLTCFGQRCPCYTEQKSCERCKCRGCRNPRQKQSNVDNSSGIDKVHRKPVTIKLLSSLKTEAAIHSNFLSHGMFPSHSRNYDQSGIEVSLGYTNSIFHSPATEQYQHS